MMCVDLQQAFRCMSVLKAIIKLTAATQHGGRDVSYLYVLIATSPAGSERIDVISCCILSLTVYLWNCSRASLGNRTIKLH